MSGHVELRDVSFRYKPDEPLIERLSLDVKPGETIAIVGPTGAGKTTVVNLLMRFYEITEVLVKRAMARLMKGRTSFVIAHRLSTIRDAHCIVVMNHGRIVEVGDHERLLASRGFYHEMYNSQFAEALDAPV